MKQFSHSKLSTYERCPLHFKFRYLTSLKPVTKNTIEAFTGGEVHKVFEVLYRDLLKAKKNSLEDLLEFFRKEWEANWDDTIAIDHQEYDEKHWYETGRQCIKNYYEQYHPFDQDQTLGVEKKLNLQLGDCTITGVIDRLSREKKGVYAIHDYKTNQSIMEQKYANADRQLALYSMWVKENFKEAKEVKLIWHMVRFGEDVESKRTDKELGLLKQDILNVIADINRAEAEDDFPAREEKCEWCGFWQHCPKKKHLFKVEKLPKNKYLKDDGVKLAKTYIELSTKKSKINKNARTDIIVIEEEMEKVKEAILEYAKKHNVETLHGDSHLVVIKKTEQSLFPTKSGDLEGYNKLEGLLISTKYWKDVSSINSTKLNQALESGAIDEEIKNKILEIAPIQEDVSISIRKNKE